MSNRVVITGCARKMLIASIVISIMAVVPASAGTDNYMFLVDQSTVVQTGGFAGVHETYSVTGQFQLTVDFSARTASFDRVDATLSDGPFQQDPSLGSLFNMTELAATTVTATLIEFEGTTPDEPSADIELVLTFKHGSIYLTGKITSPCCDFFDYSLDAVAVKVPPDPVPPCPRPIPVLKYAVASPRACLIGPPVWSTQAYYLPTGDAENFARGNGVISVPAGTRVIVCLSRDMEAVWYAGSYGCMGSSMVVQYCDLCKCEDPDSADCPEVAPDPDLCRYARCLCEQCRLVGAVCCPLPDDPVMEPCPWITIGKDGARDCGTGPGIGRAKIGVPVNFKRPGIYLLRAIVRTVAQPGYPLPLEPWREMLLDPDDPDAVLPEIPAAEDKDVIYIRVRVVERVTNEVEPKGPHSHDPDYKHIRAMKKLMDPNGPPDFSDTDLNGDEVINLADLAIMAQNWGREYEMPFTDDE